MRRPWLRPILLTALASALGAGLQWYASGGLAEISPSRIATLPVAILLGPWHGIAATLLAALPGTVPPVLLAFRIAEALIIGVAARRGHSPLLVVARHLHVAAEPTSEQVVHDVACSLFAVGRAAVDRGTRACPFVDRGAHDATRVEVDDEVRQRDEDEERERGCHYELHGRQTRS